VLQQLRQHKAFEHRLRCSCGTTGAAAQCATELQGVAGSSSSSSSSSNNNRGGGCSGICQACGRQWGATCCYCRTQRRATHIQPPQPFCSSCRSSHSSSLHSAAVWQWRGALRQFIQWQHRCACCDMHLHYCLLIANTSSSGSSCCLPHQQSDRSSCLLNCSIAGAASAQRCCM
jgi:hypothetical protein